MKLRKSILGSGLLALAFIAACSDSPATAPEAEVNSFVRKATSLELTAGANQSAQTGSTVAVAPTVRVRDNLGAPMPGVTVQFAVMSGSGAVGTANAITGADGQASPGFWKLGTEGTNELEIAVATLAPIRVSATAIAPPQPPAPPVTPPVTPPAPVPAGTYNITIRYVAPPTARQQLAVDRAVATWQNAIRGDLSNIPLNAKAGTCWPTQPAMNETVDDMLIFVEFVNIDGAGKTLGEAGPCYVRTDNSLPIMGHLKLDAADLALMEGNGTIDAVVTHEIGHIIGIGTLWSTKSLLSGAGTLDPVFTGGYAVAEWQKLGGSGSVPVENTGGEGTKEGHWRESTFGTELMTGWINQGSNPLSAMTISSLQDMGYGANTGAAAGYTLSGASRGSMAGFDIEERESVKRPKFKVDKYGKQTALPN